MRGSPMNKRGRRWLGIIALCVLVGALVSGVLVSLRPPAYTSRAVTTVAVDPRAADPAVLQGVTSSLFMLMPVYAEQAKGPVVVDAASQASGLSAPVVQQGLGVERSVDSTVLNWTFSAGDATQATNALRTATETFATELPKQGPHSQDGKALLQVEVTQAASDGAAGAITPTVGALAGAGVGALVGVAALLLLRREPGASFNDWDQVERRLGIPVVAELPADAAARTRQWGYVAARLRGLGAQERVGVFGLCTPVGEGDLDELRTSLSRLGGSAPEIVPGGLIESTAGPSAHDLDGAVIVVDSTRTPKLDLSSDTRAMSRVVPGPVIGVVDRRTPAS